LKSDRKMEFTTDEARGFRWTSPRTERRSFFETSGRYLYAPIGGARKTDLGGMRSTAAKFSPDGKWNRFSLRTEGSEKSGSCIRTAREVKQVSRIRIRIPRRPAGRRMANTFLFRKRNSESARAKSGCTTWRRLGCADHKSKANPTTERNSVRTPWRVARADGNISTSHATAPMAFDLVSSVVGLASIW